MDEDSLFFCSGSLLDGNFSEFFFNRETWKNVNYESYFMSLYFFTVLLCANMKNASAALGCFFFYQSVVMFACFPFLCLLFPANHPKKARIKTS